MPIIDGHHREEACGKLEMTPTEAAAKSGLPSAYLAVTLEPGEAIISWMVKHQEHRRNLANSMVLLETFMADPFYVEQRQAAEARKKGGKKSAGGYLGKNGKPISVNKWIAEQTGIGVQKVERLKFILEHGDDTNIEWARDGSFSIASIYKDVKEQRDKELAEDAAAKAAATALKTSAKPTAKTTSKTSGGNLLHDGMEEVEEPDEQDARLNALHEYEMKQKRADEEVGEAEEPANTGDSAESEVEDDILDFNRQNLFDSVEDGILDFNRVIQFERLSLLNPEHRMRVADKLAKLAKMLETTAERLREHVNED